MQEFLRWVDQTLRIEMFPFPYKGTAEDLTKLREKNARSVHTFLDQYIKGSPGEQKMMHSNADEWAAKLEQDQQ